MGTSNEFSARFEKCMMWIYREGRIRYEASRGMTRKPNKDIISKAAKQFNISERHIRRVGEWR